MLGHELLDQPGQPLGVTLAGRDVDEVALGVDHAERGPGPHGVLRPGEQARVVEHGVVHLVPLHGGDDGVVLGLVGELRGVDADDHEDVGETLLERPQLVEDVEAVHAAEGPEVEQNDLPAQPREGQVRAPRPDPAAGPRQLWSADTGLALRRRRHVVQSAGAIVCGLHGRPGYVPGMTLRDDLGTARFVLLTTFRRSGAPVPTPVWIATDEQGLLVLTPRGSGKVSRLRDDPRVELRPCGRFGAVADDAVTRTGTARIVEDPGPARAAIAAKYPIEHRLVLGIERGIELVKRQPRTERLSLRITLD